MNDRRPSASASPLTALRIRQTYDERFCRTWELFLLGCEVQFRHLTMMAFQVPLAREVDAVPLTCDYQFAQEGPPAAGNYHLAH